MKKGLRPSRAMPLFSNFSVLSVNLHEIVL